MKSISIQFSNSPHQLSSKTRDNKFILSCFMIRRKKKSQNSLKNFSYLHGKFTFLVMKCRNSHIALLIILNQPVVSYGDKKSQIKNKKTRVFDLLQQKNDIQCIQ